MAVFCPLRQQDTGTEESGVRDEGKVAAVQTKRKSSQQKCGDFSPTVGIIDI
jgi:hypothetical protein